MLGKSGAHDAWKKAEENCFGQPPEEKVNRRSYCCLKLPDGRAERRQN